MTNHNQLTDSPEPYWRDSVQFEKYPKLKETSRAEVGIVGGGITGLTAAYLLAQENIKVILIDSGSILNGTTGHTTAKITAQHGLIYDELIQNFGEENAKLYYQAQIEAKQMIEGNISTHDIDCDYRNEDAYIYTNKNSYIRKLELEKKAYDQLGIEGELTTEIPLNIPFKKALKMKNQAMFHPLKYLRKLVDECVKMGVQIFEQTTATDVEYNKKPTIVTRDGARIICDYVVEASQFPFYDGQGFYPTRMYAERAYVIAVKSFLTYPGGIYINAESPTRSIRSTSLNGEDLWLIGGENHKTGQGKSTTKHYQALYDYANKYFNVSDYMYRWSAQDLTTLDKIPYIGSITKTQSNVFVATGFRKWGMTNGTIAAKVITDYILNRKNPYMELFTPSRFQINPSLKQFTAVNFDVAKHLIKGKLENTKDIQSIENLTPGNALVTRINGNRTGVFMDENHKVYMLDTTCTHLRCEVEWNSGDQTWDCPCHGSRFSYTGEVITGPATRPLDQTIIDDFKKEK